MDRIARNKKNVVCPVIRSINDKTLEISMSKSKIHVGGFTWNLQVINLKLAKPTGISATLSICGTSYLSSWKVFASLGTLAVYQTADMVHFIETGAVTSIAYIGQSDSIACWNSRSLSPGGVGHHHQLIILLPTRLINRITLQLHSFYSSAFCHGHH